MNQSVLDNSGRVFGGMRIPRFTTSGPSIASARGMNRLVDTLNSLLRMQISDGSSDQVIITDSAVKIIKKPDMRDLSVLQSLQKPSLYWPFEDASPPPWVDVIQGFSLAITHGTVTSVAGKIGNGVHLSGTPAFTELGDGGGVLAPYSQVAYAGNGFTYITWFKLPSFSSSQSNPQILAMSFWNTTSSLYATVQLTWNNLAGGAFACVLDASSGGGGTLVAQQSGFPWGDNAWHFFAVSYDGTAGTIKYRVDNNAWVPNTAGSVWGIFTGVSNYVLPSMPYGKFAYNGGGGSNGDEYFDETGIWLMRNLSDPEVDSWWNSGAGRTYP